MRSKSQPSSTTLLSLPESSAKIWQLNWKRLCADISDGTERASNEMESLSDSMLSNIRSLASL